MRCVGVIVLLLTTALAGCMGFGEGPPSNDRPDATTPAETTATPTPPPMPPRPPERDGCLDAGGSGDGDAWILVVFRDLPPELLERARMEGAWVERGWGEEANATLWGARLAFVNGLHHFLVLRDEGNHTVGDQVAEDPDAVACYVGSWSRVFQEPHAVRQIIPWGEPDEAGHRTAEPRDSVWGPRHADGAPVCNRLPYTIVQVPGDYFVSLVEGSEGPPAGETFHGAQVMMSTAWVPPDQEHTGDEKWLLRVQATDWDRFEERLRDDESRLVDCWLQNLAFLPDE